MKNTNRLAEKLVGVFRSSAHKKGIMIINPAYENYIRLNVFGFIQRDMKFDIQMKRKWDRRRFFTGCLMAFSKSISGSFDDQYSVSEILYLRQDFEKIIRISGLKYL